MHRIIPIALAFVVVVSMVPTSAVAQTNETFYEMDCYGDCSNVGNAPDGWHPDPYVDYSQDFTFESDFEDAVAVPVFFSNDTDVAYAKYSQKNPAVSNGHINFTHTGELDTDDDPDAFYFQSKEGVWYTAGGGYWPGFNKSFSLQYEENIETTNGYLYNMTFDLGQLHLRFDDYQNDGTPSRVEWIHDDGSSSTVMDSTIDYDGSGGYSDITWTQEQVNGNVYFNVSITEGDGTTHNLSMQEPSGYVGGTHHLNVIMRGSALKANPAGADFYIDDYESHYPNAEYQIFGGSFYLIKSSPTNNGTGVRFPAHGQGDSPWLPEGEKVVKDTTHFRENDSNARDVSEGFTWHFDEIHTPTLYNGTGFATFGVESTNIEGDSVGLRHNFTTAGGSQSWKLTWMRSGNEQTTKTIETDFNVWAYSWNQTITTNGNRARVEITTFNESVSNVTSYNVTFENIGPYLSDTGSVAQFVEGESIPSGQEEHLKVYMLNNTFVNDPTISGGDSGGSDGDGTIDENTTIIESDTLNLQLKDDTLKPGETTKYTVHYNHDSVTNDATVLTANANVATIDSENNTVVATSNSQYYNSSTTIVAQYDGENSSQSVYVGYVTPDNIGGGGTEPGTNGTQGINDKIQFDLITAFLTLLSAHVVLFVFFIVIINTALTKITNPFVALGATEMILIIGYVVGHISVGILLLTTLLIIVLLINLRDIMYRI